MKRVMITGLGCVSALGPDVPTAWSSLLAGQTGVAEEVLHACGQDAYAVQAPLARVRHDVEAPLRERFGRKAISAVDRFSNLAAAATVEAVDDAGLRLGDDALAKASVIYATATAGLVTLEVTYQRLFDARLTDLHPLTVPRIMGSGAVSHLSMLMGAQGLCYGLTSACASSAHAVSEGMHLIRSGRAELVLVGGADACLTYGNLQAWRAVQAVSPSACRPFSRGRDGTVLGEGAATLVLESESHAKARGARIYAEMAGSGASADAAHLTKPNATTAARAVRAAHGDAGLSVDAPILISAHGTGTALNDRTEAEVFRDIYGDGLRHSRVIATKSAHGHTLGAAGAMEFLFAVLALRDGQLPPIQGYLGHDPDCNLPLVLEREASAFNAAVSTSFAFGGLNCALVARKV